MTIYRIDSDVRKSPHQVQCECTDTGSTRNLVANS